jgi:predicted nucleic acid-binding protein
MLLDSNIVIYAARPEHGHLRTLIAERAPAVSVVTRIEVLGYHRLQPNDRSALGALFDVMDVLPLTDDVASRAILLRQQKRIGLADSVIAATALATGRTLVTRNLRDFEWIPGLDVFDPLAASE